MMWKFLFQLNKFKSLLIKFSKKHFVKKYNQILMLGGYGYGNTGDEAQCNQTISTLSNRYPQYQILCLSPKPDYTFNQHNVKCDFAPRCEFFDENKNFSCYNISESLFSKLSFAITCLILILYAYLTKFNLPVVMLNVNKAKLLAQISESKLVYFCGGGYLTGRTLSRLLDGLLFCRIASILDVPVVMSGQTIGLWGNSFIKKLAQICLKDVKIISLRDNNESKNDLEAIGITKNILITHDDALFCSKSSEKQTNLNNYICFNAHNWGMNAKDSKIVYSKIHEIIDYIIQNTDYNIIFTPFIKTDEKFYNDYIKLYPEERFSIYKYDYDFNKNRRLIADSQMCITMKHHPIIFAMGENIPVISLAFSDYYMHKNKGALEQYGQEKFNINIENSQTLENFKHLFEEINTKRVIIMENISASKIALANQKEIFLKEVDKLLEKYD